jgi:hypothetical protein
VAATPPGRGVPLKRVPIILASVVVLAFTTGPSALGAIPTRHPSSKGGSIHRSIEGIGAAVRRPLSNFVASSIDCTTTATPVNTQLDCDTQLPNNEPDIVVDPGNPLHMIASSNDYDQCCDAFYTTFDGGQTWTVGDMSNEGKKRTASDPVTVIDPKTGNAIHSSLNYRFTPQGESIDGDLVVSISTDGGITWGKPVVVSDGEGADSAPLQIFNDKEWMVTDTDPDSPFYGRTYLTWSRFVARNGDYKKSPIWESHSDDGGRTWTPEQEISGSAAFCTFQTAGASGICDEDQFSVPITAPDGTVYVAFENGQNSAAWETGKEAENSYLVVRSSDGGVTWSAPVDAVDLEDGKHDLPVSVQDRQTVNGWQLRLNSAGNIVVGADGTLYVVFADNRAGTHDVAEPITDLNVYLVMSTDGGLTWSAPTAVDAGPSDQWFPWAAINPVNGQLAVIYNTRDAANTDVYNAGYAVGTPGPFTRSIVSANPSDPTNSLFFQTNAPGCKKCASFNGDYLGLDFGSDGHANLVWTDMSVVTDTFDGEPLPHPRNLQFILFARL